MHDTGQQLYAFFHGEIVPMEQAKVSVMTHALNYGTGVFEGIRGYWNEEREELYLVRLRDHFARFLKNARMLFINIPYTADELCDIAVRLTAQHEYRCDVYIRPLAYKSSEHIGVSMEGVADDFTMFVAPFGNYVDIHRGLSVCVSSWKRTDDNSIPGRAKATGNYVNSALAKNEAVRNGYDEAIVLNQLGFVSEASAANLFLVRNGKLVTPSVADGILEGITRSVVQELAQAELGVETVERSVARTELYYADEMFICGTGVQVAAITSVDGRTVGDGQVGPITQRLSELYFDAVKGRIPKYMDWLTPVHAAQRAAASAAL